jgi:hypothetical protein
VDSAGYIFVRPAIKDQALPEFAAQIFRWLNVGGFEQKVCEGKDEWDEFYFFGVAVGIEVQIHEYCKAGLEKYPFLIALNPERSRQAADYFRSTHKFWRCDFRKKVFDVSFRSPWQLFRAKMKDLFMRFQGNSWQPLLFRGRRAKAAEKSFAQVGLDIKECSRSVNCV